MISYFQKKTINPYLPCVIVHFTCRNTRGDARKEHSREILGQHLLAIIAKNARVETLVKNTYEKNTREEHLRKEYSRKITRGKKIFSKLSYLRKKMSANPCLHGRTLFSSSL